MAKITLQDLTNLSNETSAVNTINNNNHAIEDALERVVFRDGEGPDEMLAPLDMNNYPILNLPKPTSSGEPIRVADLVDMGAAPAVWGTIVGSIEDQTDLQNALNRVDAPVEGEAGFFARVKNDVSGYEAVSPDDTRDAISPLRNFHADGVTNDTTNFSTLRAAYPDTEFDLAGKTYLVDAVPPGPFRNGYFAIAGYEGELTALVPAKDTLDTALTCLAAGPYYAAWPQDKWHVWDGVIYALWMEGSVHSTSDTEKYIVCMRSKDGGKTWTQKETVYKTPGVGRSSFAAGVVDGVQFVVVRNDTTGGQSLIARRLAARYEMSGTIRTTQGSDKFRIYYEDIDEPIGAMVGTQGRFINVGDVGGLTISGEYPVSDVTNQYIEFVHGSTATDTAQGGGTSGLDNSQFSLSFSETAFQTVTFGGASLGAAIVAAFGSGSQPHIHSFSPIAGGGGAFYLGLSGADINTGVARIDDVFDDATVTFAREIPTHIELSEPTIHFDGERLMGFCRTQSEVVPQVFWHSDDELLTATITDAPGVGFAVQSPIPIAQAGDYLYGFASGQRYGPGKPFPGDSSATVPLYLLKAAKSDALANGFSAFEWMVIDEAYFANHYFAVSNAVGVGSIAVIDSETLMIGYSSEVAPDNPVQGPTRVYALKVDVGNRAKRGKSRVEPGQVVTLSDAYWFWRGHPAVADGQYMKSHNVVIESAPPAWDAVNGYFTPPETGLYNFAGEVRYAVGTVGEKYLQLVDEADVNLLGGLLIGLAIAESNTAITVGQYNVTVPLRQGQRVRLKITAPDGIANSTVRGYINIRKLT